MRPRQKAAISDLSASGGPTNTGAGTDQNQDLHRLAVERLGRIDRRYTSGLRAVVEVLAAAGRPISFADIVAARPGLARSSAYRHLMDLQSAGVARRVAADDDFARFELAEDLTEHHHHLLCVRCGAVADVRPPPMLEKAIDRALRELAAMEGFEIAGHRLDALGECRNCRP